MKNQLQIRYLVDNHEKLTLDETVFIFALYIQIFKKLELITNEDPIVFMKLNMIYLRVRNQEKIEASI